MPFALARVTIAVSVGSPMIFSFPSSSLPTVAVQARASCSKKRIFCPSKSASSGTGSEPYTQSRLTVILFMVSVPVLSEQMTEVLPSVSTDCICRMSAFFAAIFLAPCVKMSVTISESVSGTAATASVMATMIMSIVSTPPF